MTATSSTSKTATSSCMPSSSKSYLCTICSKKMSSRFSLKRHMDTHTGAKRYVCPWSGCGKAFAQNSNLKIHARLHTGERPFACTACPKAFPSGSSLHHHVETNHTRALRPRGRPPHAAPFASEALKREPSAESDVSMQSAVSPLPSSASFSSLDSYEVSPISTPCPDFNVSPILPYDSLMSTPNTSMYYMDEQNIGNFYLPELSISPSSPGMMDLSVYPEYNPILSQASQGDLGEILANVFPQNMNWTDTSLLYQPLLQ